VATSTVCATTSPLDLIVSTPEPAFSLVAKRALKSQQKATGFMADKTQDPAAQVAREMTTQELLNEVLKAELRQLRILCMAN
jgi:hypothetical protein